MNHPKTFAKLVADKNISNEDFEVINEKIVKYSNEKKIEPVKIEPSNYWLISTYRGESILHSMMKICIELGISPKDVKVKINKKARIEQDIKIMTGKVKDKDFSISLTDVIKKDINNSRVVGINILGDKRTCRVYDDAIMELFMWLSRVYGEDWGERVKKHNKEEVIHFSENIDEAKVLGKQPKQVGDTKYYFAKNINANAVMQYMHEICEEFKMNTNLITIDFRTMKIE
jgi:hypothetical protein